jgi:hypothetical protein
MSDGGAALTGLLEGLGGGFSRGYGFRQDRETRRRQQRLADELAVLRQQEAQRQQAQEARAATTFGEQQAEYQRVQGLRQEIGTQLAVPPRQTLGEYLQGQPGTRRPGAPPLSPEALVAREKGRLLAGYAGRDAVTDPEALLLGAGEIPAGAVAPRTYHPRTREEYLANLRIAAGLRGRGAGGRGATDPLAVDQRAVIREADRLYDEGQGEYDHWDDAYSEAVRRYQTAGRLSGTQRPSGTREDIPSIVRQYIASRTGGLPPGMSAAPAGRPIPSQYQPQPAQTEMPDAEELPDVPGPGEEEPGDRIQNARGLVADPRYRGLPRAEIADVLRELGYSPQEIQAILGGP